MLSSAKKSVPTIKQFVQPYFIQIAPSGAITAVCERFEELLNDFRFGYCLEVNAIDIFSRLGVIHTVTDTGFFDPKFSLADLPPLFDLFINAANDLSANGNPSFLIRWVSTPDGENSGGYQLTGIR